MLRGLRENSLQIALALITRPSAKTLKGLIVEEFCRQSVCVALHQDHPLARCYHLDLRSLADERLIGYSYDEYPEYREWLTSIFPPFEQLPRTFEEHDSSTSIIAVVEAGRGVALVPRCFEFLV